MPLDRDLDVRIYSNKPASIQERDNFFKKVYNLAPNNASYMNEIPILVKFDNEQAMDGPSLVNAVDERSGKLEYSWLLVIDSISQPRF